MTSELQRLTVNELITEIELRNEAIKIGGKQEERLRARVKELESKEYIEHLMKPYKNQVICQYDKANELKAGLGELKKEIYLLIEKNQKSATKNQQLQDKIEELDKKHKSTWKMVCAGTQEYNKLEVVYNQANKLNAQLVDALKQIVKEDDPQGYFAGMANKALAAAKEKTW